MNRWAEPPPGSPPEPSGPFAPVTFDGLLYLTRNMRPVDQEEIYNWIGHKCPEALAMEMHDLFRARGRGRLVLYEDKPAAWIGVIEMPELAEEYSVPDGVWQVTMGGTLYLPMVAYFCMTWARWSTRETKHNGRILLCDSREGHTEAHKFLLTLGAKVESTVRTGWDGAKYYRFFWRYGENDEGVSREGRPNAAVSHPRTPSAYRRASLTQSA